MKKPLALLLSVLLAFAILPTIAFAADDNVFDISEHAKWKAYSDGNAGLALRSSEYGDLIKDVTLVNTSGLPATITLWPGNDGLVMENVTAGPGIVFDIQAPANAPIVIKNCTFQGAVKNAGGEFLYAITVGSKITLIDNVFDGVYRGVNAIPNGTVNQHSITATGNTFKPAPNPESPVDCIGIQISGNGSAWAAGSIVIQNNIFENAYAAVRLHHSVKIAADAGTAPVITFSENTLTDCTNVIVAHPDAEQKGTLANLQSILDNNTDINNNVEQTTPVEVTDPEFDFNGFIELLKSLPDNIRWFIETLTKFIQAFLIF